MTRKPRLFYVCICTMRHPMAANLLKVGYPLIVHDLERDKADDLIAAGAIWAGTLAAGVAAADVVITMGCGDACPWMPAKQFIDWQIPDPKHMEPKEFNEIRDMISEKVKALISSL
mgnify:CR=1 FL=1